MMKRASMIALLAAAVGAAPAGAATILSENFESGTTGAFVATGQVGVIAGSVLTTAPNGFSGSASAQANHYADFGSGNSFLGGNLLASTIAGASAVTNYTLSFDAGRIGSSLGEYLLVSVTDAAGKVISDSLIGSALSSSSSLDTALSTHTYNFSASGPISLSFTGGGSPGDNTDVLLDNISLSASAVPEPAAWTLMIVGFGGVGASLRSRRSKLQMGRAVVA